MNLFGLKVDDVIDWWRLVAFALCLIALVILMRRFVQFRDDWNEKTRDQWYSLVMWIVAGGAYAIQGIFFEVPFGPALVIMTAAVLVSLKALLQKGTWGGDDSKKVPGTKAT